MNDTWDWNRGRLIFYYSSNHLWGQSDTDNNGNVRFAETWIPPENATLDQTETLSEQSYEYDALNRLKSVAEQRMSVSSGWGSWQQQFKQSYDYDRYGNRTIKTGMTDTWGTGINNRSFEIEATTNRLYSPDDLVLPDTQRRIRYDAAGNQYKDTYTGYGNATFDAENHITTIQNNLGGTSTYNYNADGQRTRRKISNQETWQIYGFDGELLAEYAASGATASAQKEYGYRNGQLLITTDDATGENVSWTNVVGATASGNSLTKTAPTAWGNAGAASTKSIVSGDGYVEFRVTSLLTGMVALSHSDANQDYTSMEFALLPASDGNLYVFESGVNRGPVSSYTTNDVFRVAVEGGVVKYRKNGALVYTSTQTPTYPLLVDAGLYHNGGTFSNVVINGNLSGASGPSTRIQWLLTDHLGTPRMIIRPDRHSRAHQAPRLSPLRRRVTRTRRRPSVSVGLLSGDGVRQQFTQKERDVETGLDYFGARYYASIHGRFTGVDPYDINLERQNTTDPEEADALFRNYISEPQHWNRYTHTLNNPLRYVDPDGFMEYETELLGQNIKVHIDDSIIKKDKDAESRIKANLQKAFDKINAGATRLTADQIESIHSQNRIYVTNEIEGPRTMGDTFYITQRTAENPNIDKLAADIIHDSRHSEQFARGLSYKGANAIPMEREASLFALGVIDIIGGWDNNVIRVTKLMR